MGIRDIGGSGSPWQRAYGLSLRPVQRDYPSPLKLNHPPKAHLPGRVPNDLCQSRGLERGSDHPPSERCRESEGSGGRSVPARSARRRRKQFRSRGLPALGDRLSRRKHPPGPGALPGLGRPAGCVQSFIDHGAECGRALQRFLDRLLDETGDGRRLLCRDALADLFKLAVGQGDREFRGRHATHHTTGPLCPIHIVRVSAQHCCWTLELDHHGSRTVALA